MATPEEIEKQKKQIEAAKQQNTVKPATNSTAKAPIARKWTHGTDDWKKHWSTREEFLKANKDYQFTDGDAYDLLDIPVKKQTNDVVIEGITVPAAQLQPGYEKVLNNIDNDLNNRGGFLQETKALDMPDGTQGHVIQKDLTRRAAYIQELLAQGRYYDAAIAKKKLSVLTNQYKEYARQAYKNTFSQFKHYGTRASNELENYTGYTTDQLENAGIVNDSDISSANINAMVPRLGTYITGAGSGLIPGGFLASVPAETANGLSVASIANKLEAARFRGDHQAVAMLEAQLRSAKGVASQMNDFSIAQMVTALPKLVWQGGKYIASKALSKAAPGVVQTAAQSAVPAAANATATAANATATAANASKWMTNIYKLTDRYAGAAKLVSAGAGGVATLNMALKAHTGYSPVSPIILKAMGHGDDLVKLDYAATTLHNDKVLDELYKTSIITGDTTELEKYLANKEVDFTNRYNKLYEKYNGNIPEAEVTELVNDRYFARGYVPESFFQSDLWLNATPAQHKQWITSLATTRMLAHYKVGEATGRPTVLGAMEVAKKLKNPTEMIDYVWNNDSKFRAHISDAIQQTPYKSIIEMAGADNSNTGNPGAYLFGKVLTSNPNYAEDFIVKGVDYYYEHPEELRKIASNPNLNNMFASLANQLESSENGIYDFIDKMKHPAAILNKAGTIIVAMKRHDIPLPPALKSIESKADDIASYIFRKNPIAAMPAFVSLFFRRNGNDKVADFLQNPTAFYLTAATIAVGGIGLASSLLSKDDDDPVGDEDSSLDYDTKAFKRRIRRQHSNSIYDNLFTQGGAD